MPMQVTTKKLSEVAKKAALPVATVDAKLGNRNGRDGILVEVFYPLPDDEQIEIDTRMGKGDNADKVSSVLSVFGRATGEDLTYLGEDNERYGVLDGSGNQIIFTGRIFNRIKGEAAEDAEADEV